MKNATSSAPDFGSQIQQLHAISKALLLCAQQGNWSEVEKLNLKRNDVLLALADSPDSGKTVNQETVTEILNLDREILTLTNSAMNDIAHQVSSIAVKSRISKEYRSVQTISQ